MGCSLGRAGVPRHLDCNVRRDAPFPVAQNANDLFYRGFRRGGTGRNFCADDTPRERDILRVARVDLRPKKSVLRWPAADRTDRRSAFREQTPLTACRPPRNARSAGHLVERAGEEEAERQPPGGSHSRQRAGYGGCTGEAPRAAEKSAKPARRSRNPPGPGEKSGAKKTGR
jgi:hypothetical protein